MNILSELGVNDLPEEEKKNLMASLSESFLRRMTVRIYENLDENGRLEFEKIAAENIPEKLDRFVKSRIPNIEAIQKKELEELVREIKDFQSENK